MTARLLLLVSPARFRTANMCKLLFLLCLLSAQAWATDRYAAVGGLTSGQCDSIGIACTVRQCITAAANTETCYLSAGTYPAAELGASNYVIETGEFVNLVCSGAVGSCIFQPSGANVSGIRLNSPVAGGTVAFTGIKIDGSLATPLDQCFYYNDTAALYTVTSTDNTCTEADIYGHRIVANEMTLTSTRDTMTASTAVSPRSFVNTAGTWAEGGISIDGANVTISKYDDTATPIVNILATDAGETGSVTNSSFTITNDPATTTGYIDVIQFRAIPNAIATGNTIKVTGANVGTTGSACAAASCRQVRAIKSYSSSALDSSGANLSNNTITFEAANGIGVSVGDDQTGAGDTYSAFGKANGNTIICTASGTSAHGVGLFWSQGGVASGNFVRGCGIGLLSKDQPTAGGLFSGNILIDIAESYMYAKGSTAPQFINNTLSVSNSTGTPVVIGIDGATNSTNVTLDNNNIVSTGGQPTNLLNTASSQTIAEATSNNWYGFTAPRWTYLGTAYTTLGTWNAVGAVGTDVEVGPGFVGGTAPTTTAGFRLTSASPLRRVGLDLNIGNVQDAGKRAFSHPPSIGAWEAASGDLAAERTLR